METNLEYLLDSGNILNMFEIQIYRNKISQKDGYLHSKLHCLLNIGPTLHCSIGDDNIFRFASALKLVCFFRFLEF